MIANFKGESPIKGSFFFFRKDERNMSLAKICDRCGQYYKVYNEKKDKNHTNGFMLANIDKYGKYYSHSPIDLCPECMESLINWRDSLDLKNIDEIKDMRKKLYNYCNTKRCSECIFNNYSSCNYYTLSDDAIQDLYKKLMEEEEICH